MQHTRSIRPSASLLSWTFVLLTGLLASGPFGVSRAQAQQGRDWPAVPHGALYWQLQGDITLDPDAIKVVGADPDEVSSDDVFAWRAAGLFPVCYINVGASEAWRDDANAFPDDVIGHAYWGWDGENWLDITRFDRFADVMTARMDRCRDMGFLGVEPDNIDAFEADLTNKTTGFAITKADQLGYVRWLIGQAHARGLAIGQKNAPELVGELVGEMDFALLESAFRLGFMAEFDPYIAQGKPVFAVEYSDEGIDALAFCPVAKSHGFQGLIAQTDLDRAPQNCP